MDNEWVNRVPGIWQHEVANMVRFSQELSIIAAPQYPHRRRWRWWHKHLCAGCAQAKSDWPEQQRKLLKRLHV